MSTIGYINVSLETFGGLLSLIFLLCLSIPKRKRSQVEKHYCRLLACNTILLFCDAGAWLFKGRPGILSFFAVHLSNFLVYALGYVMLALFTNYLTCFLLEKKAVITRKPACFMWGGAAVAIALVVLSQFNHMYYLIDGQNIYRRQDFFWLSQIFGLIGLFLNLTLLIRYRRYLVKRELTAFYIYVMLPAMALLFQILFYSVAVLYLATTVCLICIYIGIQMELSREAGERELELERSRTALMMSQIKPHFLYNSLLCIKQLCDEEPPKASDAVSHFIFFLQGNLHSLSTLDLIPFAKEMDHVKNYLYLEEMRFEKPVDVRWEIDYSDFCLPALTLQPIVENALRHGLYKKEGSRTLTVRSEKKEAAVLITISDDGIGFCVDRTAGDDRPHIGIENVRKRLETQCGGTLEIKSAPGKGTVATITLPGA